MIAFDVCYEDADLVIVCKPAGCHTQPPASRAESSLLDAVTERFGAGVRLVHRLDYDASGLVVFARRQDVAGTLGKAFEAHAVRRTYRALIPIPLPAGQGGVIDAPLASGGGKAWVSASGQRAVTHWRVLGETAGFTELEIELETGRMHQIRVHLAHALSPIVGDTKYGGAPWTRLALHAARLELRHPRFGRAVTADAPPPWSTGG